MRKVRDFFERTGGKVVAGLILVAAACAGWYTFRNYFGQSEAAALSNERVFICAVTGKTFRRKLEAGMMIPVRSPHSGQDTGYEAEKCFWTKQGTARAEPSYVLLNDHKPEYRGTKAPPTFCPDCGRLVRPLNPAPAAGVKAPPTQAEYLERRSRSEG
jgi:hypothetical protein